MIQTRSQFVSLCAYRSIPRKRSRVLAAQAPKLSVGSYMEEVLDSLTSQTRPTPAWITSIIMHGEERVWWCLVGFHVLWCECHIYHPIGYGHTALG